MDRQFEDLWFDYESRVAGVFFLNGMFRYKNIGEDAILRSKFDCNM